MKIAKFSHVENEAELVQLLKDFSTGMAGQVITASVYFGTVTIYAYAARYRVPVNSRQSLYMINFHDCIGYLDGQPVPPNRAWIRRNRLAQRPPLTL